MAQSDELTQRLFEAVDTIIGERISSLPYDQTIVCKIVDATDKANGIYIVSHDFDTTFTAYADFTGFEVGDDVYVRIPEGDYTQQKVITGKYLEGILLAGETQNISIIGDTNYLLYNKNNQIHLYDWCKTQHEIQFSYFNTSNEEQTWKDVLNTFSNLSMDYERANAIKLTIGNNDEIIIYLYKYKDSNKKDRFAAEQYGVTPLTYIPDIEQHEQESQAFIKVSNEILFVQVTDEMTYNNQIRYYIIDNGNYKWVNNAASNMTDFAENITYYYIPSNINFYQDSRIEDDPNILPDSLVPINVNPLDAQGKLIEVDDVFDFSQPIWYWVPGELEIDVSQIPMLNTAKIYYTEDTTGINGVFHLAYTISSELDTAHATIPINIQYCPSGETTNIRANTTLNFGYITELNEEINIELQLKRTIDGVTDIVPAITIGDENGQYSLEILLTDKFGNKISNNIFNYRWEYNGIIINNTTGINAINNIVEMPSHGEVIILQIGFEVENNFIVYRTLYYPLAYRSNANYYIESPTTILYNEAGVNPVYYDGIIQLKTYDETDIDKERLFFIPENNGLYTLINNKIMSVYNIYKGTPDISYFSISIDDVIVWLQSLYFTKRDRQAYIQIKNYQELDSPIYKYPGALAAKTADASGLAINYTDSILSIEQYNNENNSISPIFYIDSTGVLKLGYDNFTMTGHISEGARYLESSRNNPIQQGSLVRPVYFTSTGTPAAIGTAILNSNATLPDADIGNYKIIPQLITSRVEQINVAEKTIDNIDNGKFFIASSNSTIILPQTDIGVEFELMKFGSSNVVTLIGDITVKLITADNGEGTTSITISDNGGVIAAKYLGYIDNDCYWIITGTID